MLVKMAFQGWKAIFFLLTKKINSLPDTKAGQELAGNFVIQLPFLGLGHL